MDPPCFTLMKLMENVCASIDILILPSAKLIELRKKMNFKLVNILSFIVVLARYKKQFSFFSFLNFFLLGLDFVVWSYAQLLQILGKMKKYLSWWVFFLQSVFSFLTNSFFQFL